MINNVKFEIFTLLILLNMILSLPHQAQGIRRSEDETIIDPRSALSVYRAEDFRDVSSPISPDALSRLVGRSFLKDAQSFLKDAQFCATQFTSRRSQLLDRQRRLMIVLHIVFGVCKGVPANVLALTCGDDDFMLTLPGGIALCPVSVAKRFLTPNEQDYINGCRDRFFLHIAKHWYCKGQPLTIEEQEEHRPSSGFAVLGLPLKTAVVPYVIRQLFSKTSFFCQTGLRLLWRGGDSVFSVYNSNGIDPTNLYTVFSAPTDTSGFMPFSQFSGAMDCEVQVYAVLPRERNGMAKEERAGKSTYLAHGIVDVIPYDETSAIDFYFDFFMPISNTITRQGSFYVINQESRLCRVSSVPRCLSIGFPRKTDRAHPHRKEKSVPRGLSELLRDRPLIGG
ncbi:MAG: hypothetical protein LBD15_02270 [Holosporales bacterium]|jgi:hypothetical protein|nr:hypothetical protein [Holosporales bacterium]